MAVGPEVRSGESADPPEFVAAVAGLHTARMRSEVFCEEMQAPQRIAPHSAALSADVAIDGVDVGTGRIVVLYDPEGNEAWQGTFRCVAYVRAEVDPEALTDQLLGEVGWSWLTEALDAHGAHYLAASGTVTRVATENFGGMAEDIGTAQIEIRASWTPRSVAGDHAPGLDDGPDLTAHAEAWGELLCTAAGLPPVPVGVTSMPSRRGQRGPHGDR
jgi:hypothetical protein